MTTGSTTQDLAHSILAARARLNEALAAGTKHEQQQAREWLDSYESQARHIFDEKIPD